MPEPFDHTDRPPTPTRAHQIASVLSDHSAGILRDLRRRGGSYCAAASAPVRWDRSTRPLEPPTPAEAARLRPLLRCEPDAAGVRIALTPLGDAVADVLSADETHP